MACRLPTKFNRIVNESVPVIAEELRQECERAIENWRWRGCIGEQPKMSAHKLLAEGLEYVALLRSLQG